MRKFIYFVFVAISAMLFVSSCSKDDVIYRENTSIGNTIDVTAMVSGDVAKSAAKTTTTDSLKSFAMYMYNDGVLLSTNAGLEFTRPDKSGDVWKHDGNYYWSAGKYAFFGVAVNNTYTNNFNNFITADGIQIGREDVPYLIKTDGKTNEKGIYDEPVSSVQQDLVIAGDTVTRDAGNNGNKIVRLRFYHALSRVRVVLSNYNPNDCNLRLTAVGYEFRGVGVKGYMTTPFVHFTNDKDTLAWTICETGNVRENSVARPEKFSNIGYYTDVIPEDSWCTVIPGTPATELVFKVALYNTTGNFVGMRYLTTDATGVDSYLSGRQYTYYVYITDDGGEDTDGDDPDKEPLKISISHVDVTNWININGGISEFSR